MSRLSTIVTLCRADREGMFGSVGARLPSLPQTGTVFGGFVLLFLARLRREEGGGRKKSQGQETAAVLPVYPGLV